MTIWRGIIQEHTHTGSNSDERPSLLQSSARFPFPPLWRKVVGSSYRYVTSTSGICSMNGLLELSQTETGFLLLPCGEKKWQRLVLLITTHHHVNFSIADCTRAQIMIISGLHAPTLSQGRQKLTHGHQNTRFFKKINHQTQRHSNDNDPLIPLGFAVSW